jgi:hypothetical protein
MHWLESYLPSHWLESYLPSWAVPTEPVLRDAAIGSVLGVVAVVATPVVVTAAGFTSTGIVGGSFASWLMSSTTAAGSVFAACQSIGATGGLGWAAGTAAVAGGAITNTVGGRVLRRGE